MMRLVLLVFSLCALLVSASKRSIFSDSYSYLKELCRRGDAGGVEQILASGEEPNKEDLIESFRVAHRAGNYQICRLIAHKLPRKCVLREVMKSKDFKSLKSILGEGSTNLRGVDEMFLDHCLKHCSGCEGVPAELKLLLKLPSLNTVLISKILIGLINLDLYNVDILRLLLEDGRFESLFACSFFFNCTMDNMRMLSCQDYNQYDIFMTVLMSTPAWLKITSDWKVEAHTYFMSKLCKYGAMHALKSYLSNNKVGQQQLNLCISDMLCNQSTFSPFVLSILLDQPFSEPNTVEFLKSLQVLIKTWKHKISSKLVLLENYMVLVFFLFRCKELKQLAKGHSLQDLYQELIDYLAVTRIKYMQINGIGCLPTDITRLIGLTYLSLSGFQ